MAERAGSIKPGASENDPMAGFEFKPLAREEYYLDDVFALYFQLPGPDRCPSYLDVIRIAPLHEVSRLKKQTPRYELTFSYCRWNIESGDGQYSVRVKVQDIVAMNDNFSNAEGGIVHVAQYIASPDNKVIAESTPFRIFPVFEEATMNLPEVFSDDGLIVLGSGSDSESEIVYEEPVILEEEIDFSNVEPKIFEEEIDFSYVEPKVINDEPAKGWPEENSENSDREDEELTIVLTERELRKMENENRASNEKLRSFIDQYKKDLLELTKRNETLKHKLYDEQNKVTNLERLQGEMSTELMELRGAKLRVEAILKETITERERKLREEQNRTFKLEEEVSLLNGQVENLRCCVDAHLETKNLLVAEMDSLRLKQEPVMKNLLDKATSTSFIQESVKSREPNHSADEEILLLEKSRKKLKEEIMRLLSAKRELWRDFVRMKGEMVPSTRSTDASDIGECFKVTGQQNTDLEDRVQDLTKRLQAAKLEYISLYKENKRKEKALENICNWASLAKDGMSLEAPEPSQVPSLVSLTSSKFTSSFDALFPKMMSNPPASSATNDRAPEGSFSGFLGMKPRTSGLESFDDDFIQLSSDSKLPLPPRQKRKYDLLRKSSATVAAGIASSAVSRAMQRGKIVVRGRHRAYEPVRFPLKRETPSPGKELLDYTPSCLLPATSPPKPAQSARSRMIFKKKEVPKPSAPEPTSVDESAQEDSGASAAVVPRIPRGSNTYSAAGLISDLETDASNTEEEPSVSNPNICPLCVTSILDYEAHMREAHQKQPCPICGYVFDTNIPLHVMTYHIERHLEDVEENLPTQ